MTRIFRVDRDKILKNLTSWAQNLAGKPEVLSVVLFGSFARGDCTAASDADLLILLHDSMLRFDERIPVYRPSGMGVSVDVFPYTLSEARQSLKEGWGVVGVALKEGLTLYQADSTLEILLA